MIQEILTLTDVETFARQLVEEGVSIHPDEDFACYIEISTGEDYYTKGEVDLRNRLMEQCFKVCEENGVDIYSTMMETFLIEKGLDVYIPLPSIVSQGEWIEG
jgi:hypothetical protein